jgi:hypothetical protein
MGSGTFYPAAGADDGYWMTGGSLWASRDYCSFGDFYGDFSSFFRFANVTIPPGSIITSAFIRLTAQEAQSGIPCNVNIYFNNEDDATNPTSSAEAAGKAVTAKIDWDDIPAFTEGVSYDTPELNTILQTVVDRGGFSSGNHILVFIKEEGETGSPVWRKVSSIEYLSGAEKAELHVGWTTPVYELNENVNVLSEFDNNFGELNENVNVLSEFDNNFGELNEDVSVNAEFIVLSSDGIDEDISVNSELISEHTGEISEDASVNSDFISEHTAELSEEASVNSEFGVARHLTIQETLSSWDTLKWGWDKTIADSLAIADTVSKILGIPVKDWLSITDTETNNWNGVEAVSDSLYVVDISKVIQIYEDLIADGMAITDAVKLALRLIVTDILTCTDTVINTGTFQHSIEDGMTLEDVAKRIFPKSISDSFAVTDTSLVDFLALLQVSDSFAATDTASRLLTINKTIADSLEALDAVTVQQLIQELIQDGLNIEVSIIIDGEVYECFVLNTSAFHVSVYSNYEFNSFAIDRSNNICYGCKSDGIYTLEGDSDNGTAFKSGIILPSSQFNSPNNKRFRKGFLAVEGNNVILKAETDNGYRTYLVTDTEASITRDLKGRSWQFSVEGFDSLDSIDLVPIILSRK